MMIQKIIRPLALVILLFFLAGGVVSLAAPVFAANDDKATEETKEPKKFEPKKIKLQAPLPGAEEITYGAGVKGGYIMQYVTTIYTYVAGIGGLLAVLMMVMGGFQVMTSGTNPAGVTAGKERIINAVGGLILLLVSALLLYTINPNAFTVFEPKKEVQQAEETK